MPASFEAKARNKASQEGGEDSIQGTEMRAASGKKRPVFVPLGGSRWVKRDIAGGSRGSWEGCWEASRAIALSPGILWFAEPQMGRGHGGKGTEAGWNNPVWTGQEACNL